MVFVVLCVMQYAFYFLVVGAAIWASSWAGKAKNFIKIESLFVFKNWELHKT